MKIKNPIDKDLNLRYLGEDYTLEAGVSKEFPEDVVAQWIRIYGFLSISSATNKEVDTVVDEVKKAEEEEKKTAKKTAKKAAKKK